MPRFAAPCVSQVLFFFLFACLFVRLCTYLCMCVGVLFLRVSVFMHICAHAHSQSLVFLLPQTPLFPSSSSRISRRWQLPLGAAPCDCRASAVMRAPAFFSIYAVSSIFEIRENRERGE